MVDQHYYLTRWLFFREFMSEHYMWWSAVHTLCVLLMMQSFAPALSFFFLFLSPLCHRLLCHPHFLSKVKVRDLEQRCRSQNEHYHQLSKELLNFRLQSDTVDILKLNPTPTSHIPASPEKTLSQVDVGFETLDKTGGSLASAQGRFRAKKKLHIYFCNWLLLSL